MPVRDRRRPQRQSLGWRAAHRHARLRDGKIAAFTKAIFGLAGNDVSAVIEDRTAPCGFPAETGLTQLKDGHFRAFTAGGRVSRKDGRVIRPSRSGALRIGTYGSGLIPPLCGRRLPHVDDHGLMGLSSNDVRSIYEDADGVLVGRHPAAVPELAPPRRTRQPHLVFRRADGLSTTSSRRFLEDDDGRSVDERESRIWAWVSRAELNAAAAAGHGGLMSITSIAHRGLEEGLVTVETNGGFPLPARAPPTAASGFRPSTRPRRDRSRRGRRSRICRPRRPSRALTWMADR